MSSLVTPSQSATPAATKATTPRRTLTSIVKGVVSDSDDDFAAPAASGDISTTAAVGFSPIMHVPMNLTCRPGSWPEFKSNAIAGAFSLSLAFAFMHPLDTIKTQLQADVHSQQKFRQMFSAATGRTLLNGFWASIAGAAPQGAIRFSIYENTKLRIRRNYRESQPALCTPLVSSALSAMAGDMASSVVKVPREVITQRLQATQLYSSTWDAVRSVMRVEGVRGFYTGYVSTQARDLPFMMFLFSCYENIKSLTGSLCEESSIASALFGASSGAFAGFVTTPMDVIKTRIMTSAIPTAAGGSIVHLSLSQSAHQIVSANGWRRGLFTGAAPRSIWWFGVCGIFFPAYETSKAWIHHYHALEHAHEQDMDHSMHQH